MKNCKKQVSIFFTEVILSNYPDKPCLLSNKLLMKQFFFITLQENTLNKKNRCINFRYFHVKINHINAKQKPRNKPRHVCGVHTQPSLKSGVRKLGLAEETARSATSAALPHTHTHKTRKSSRYPRSSFLADASSEN